MTAIVEKETLLGLIRAGKTTSDVLLTNKQVVLAELFETSRCTESGLGRKTRCDEI